MRAGYGVAISLLALVLSGCTGSDGLEDLREFVKNAHADRKPKIEPLPEIKPHETFPYAAMHLADPFAQVNLRPPSSVSGGSGPRPDMNRRKEPLEDFPLDALKMVGTLSRGKQSWAVIQAPDGSVHRLQVGDHAGQNFGKVLKITEEKVALVELVQSASGEWVEREASLAIAE
jgi:type IV pilus assembly protein PilP